MQRYTVQFLCLREVEIETEYPGVAIPVARARLAAHEHATVLYERVVGDEGIVADWQTAVGIDDEELRVADGLVPGAKIRWKP